MLGLDSLGIPLHPLVVHFPIVFSVLLPISALVALWAIRKGTTPRWALALPVAVAAALTVSAYAATETGEREEDRVERVVTERAIHGHEETAGVQVGHSGGELVYRHGAASAHADGGGADAVGAPASVATAPADSGGRSDGDDR